MASYIIKKLSHIYLISWKDTVRVCQKLKFRYYAFCWSAVHCLLHRMGMHLRTIYWRLCNWMVWLQKTLPLYSYSLCTVLQKLNSHIYSGLKTEVQELLFRKLVAVFQNSNGDLQNATRAALQRLHITCSTIVHTLDHILKDGSCASRSVHRTKKMKR